MAIGVSPTQCGTAPSAASSSSWTLTTTAALDAGEVGVLRVAFDNISTVDGDNNEVASITGGTGSWEKLAEYTNSQGTAANGVTVSAWLFTPSASNAVGTTITITLQSNRTQKVAALEKWSVGSGNSLRQTSEASIVTSQVDAAAGFGSVTYSGLTDKERLYLRVLGAEMSTTVSVSPTSGFTALSTYRSSTSSPISLLGEFDVATSTGSTSNPNFTPVADKVGLFLALEEYTPSGGSITGTATGDIGIITGTASASLQLVGTVNGSIGAITGTSVSKAPLLAVASGSIGAITGLGSASLAIRANAPGSIGPITGTASAKLTIRAIALGSIGQVTGSALSSARLRASVLGLIGQITGTASAKLTIRATAVGSIGPVTGTSSTDLETRAVANRSIGQVTGTATGQLAIRANASGSIGSITGSSSGAPSPTEANAAGSIGQITGTASAKLTIRAIALGLIGQVTGSSASSLRARASTLRSIGQITGSAVGFQSILNSGHVEGSIGSITGSALGRSGTAVPTHHIRLTVHVKSLQHTVSLKRTKFKTRPKPLSFTIEGHRND